jgi:hypothetical protein
MWQFALARAPIRVLDATTPQDITDEMQVRLDAVLRMYECTPTPEGWRQLALKLALAHEPALRTETPVDRQKGEAGAEPSSDRFFLLWRLNSAKKRLGSAAAAAREIAKQSLGELSEASLRNLMSEAAKGKVRPPRWVRRRRGAKTRHLTASVPRSTYMEEK